MQGILDLPGTMAQSLQELATTMAFGRDPMPPPQLAPTPKDTVLRDGIAQLYRFRRPEGAPAALRGARCCVVPSMINRWYVLDLRRGNELLRGLVAAGHRRLPPRLGRAPRRGPLPHLGRGARPPRTAWCARCCATPAPTASGILGYCMGATLSSIYTALHPEKVCALVNLAGPIDFSKGGLLGAHGRPPLVRQQRGGRRGQRPRRRRCRTGFSAMRPTLKLSKIVGYSRPHGASRRATGSTRWRPGATTTSPSPRRRTETYITELYQKNLLVRGEHRVRGRVARTSRTSPAPSWPSAPSATPSARCPRRSAAHRARGSQRHATCHVPGGHVGAVVGRPRVEGALPCRPPQWLRERLDA
jgi:polyhydroxyalkanoate synthase